LLLAKKGLSSAQSIKSLNEGDNASFDIEQGPKGPAAANVNVI